MPPNRSTTFAIAAPVVAASVRSTPPISSAPSGALPAAWSIRATFSPWASAASTTALPRIPWPPVTTRVRVVMSVSLEVT